MEYVTFPRVALTHRIWLGCLATGLALVASCDLPSSSQIQTKAIWRFAIEESEGSVQHEYALRFKQLVEERTAGEVEVAIYPYGTLGTSTHITEQLNMGVIEFAMASPGSLGKFIPELQVFLLHFVLPEDDRQTQQLLSDPQLVAYFDELYAPKGLKLLSVFSEGEMVWTMKQEVRRPEDFQGIKMRVMTSPLLLAAYNAYGSSATPMPYSEVYSGLQLNMIDGQVNPIFAIERQKFHEVTSWLIFPGHTSFVTTCAANRRFFNGLPREQSELVTQVIDELDDYIFEVQTRFQTERLKTIILDKQRQQSQLTICGDLTPFLSTLTDQEREELIDNNDFLTLAPAFSTAERQAFRQASQTVREVYLDIGGPRSEEVLTVLVPTSATTDGDDTLSEKSQSGEAPATNILFLGNSITLHAPAPAIGWTGNWGMAASTQEKDYVHLLTASIAAATGAPPQTMVKNIAVFERQYETYDIAANLKSELDFNADIVILAIGENTTEPKTEPENAKFAMAFSRLLAELKQHGQPEIFVRSSFWPNETKDGIMRKASADAGATFIDISAVGLDKTNEARAERKIEHAGVASHPGDKGMQEIADAIFAAMRKRLELSQPTQQP